MWKNVILIETNLVLLFRLREQQLLILKNIKYIYVHIIHIARCDFSSFIYLLL